MQLKLSVYWNAVQLWNVFLLIPGIRFCCFYMINEVRVVSCCRLQFRWNCLLIAWTPMKERCRNCTSSLFQGGPIAVSVQTVPCSQARNFAPVIRILSIVCGQKKPSPARSCLCPSSTVPYYCCPCLYMPCLCFVVSVKELVINVNRNGQVASFPGSLSFFVPRMTQVEGAFLYLSKRYSIKTS
jgi:hypothetical protein